MELSRQRKWQLKKEAQGLCPHCGKAPRVGKAFCQTAIAKMAVTQKRRMADPHKFAAHSDYMKMWRAANIDHIRHYHRKWYSQNKQKRKGTA